MHDQTAHLFAGGAAGLATCLALQPLDLIKTRMQQGKHSAAQSEIIVQSQSVRTAFQSVIRKDGVFGLWRGTVPTVLRNVPGSAMYFAVLESVRSLLPTNHDNQRKSHINNIIAGAFARASVGIIVMPVTVIKTRYESNLYNYKSMHQAATAIYRAEGIRGLFAGFGSTALRDAPYSGIYVVIYEILKGHFQSTYKMTTNNVKALDYTMGNAIAASISSFAATCLTHPFDVIRTRIQVDPKQYRNIHETTQMIWRQEQIRGFFRGLVPRVLRKCLSAAITWSMYEKVVLVLKNKA